MGEGTAIIEIETGFTPPEHALDTVDYYAARIVSKIARYSKYCEKFSLATPVVNILPMSKIFLLPPNARNLDDIKPGGLGTFFINQIICTNNIRWKNNFTIIVFGFI